MSCLPAQCSVDGPQNFQRKTETTSSVRLRRRKNDRDLNGGATTADVYRRNRHSGDFYINSRPSPNVAGTENLMETLDRKIGVSVTSTFKQFRQDAGKHLMNDVGNQKITQNCGFPPARIYRPLPITRRSTFQSLGTEIDRMENSQIELRTNSNYGQFSGAIENSRNRHVSLLSEMSSEDKRLGQNRPASSVFDSVVDSPMREDDAVSCIKKGILWHQKERFFSRWKERYFYLTNDYLQCFRRDSSSSRHTEMGAFLFKFKLVEVENVELIDKRGYLTICLHLPKDVVVLFRRPEGIRDWHVKIKECVLRCKEKRGVMQSSKAFWSKFQTKIQSDRSSLPIGSENEKDFVSDHTRSLVCHPNHLNRYPNKYSYIESPNIFDKAKSKHENELVRKTCVNRIGHSDKGGGGDSQSNMSQDSGIDSIEKSTVNNLGNGMVRTATCIPSNDEQRPKQWTTSLFPISQYMSNESHLTANAHRRSIWDKSEDEKQNLDASNSKKLNIFSRRRSECVTHETFNQFPQLCITEQATRKTKK